MRTKRHRISSDFILILSSLLIAFVIWLIAAEADIETDNLTVSVEVINSPENYNIEIAPKETIITVQYPKAQKSSIISPNFKVVIDLNNLPEFTQREPLISTTWVLSPVDVVKNKNVSERVKVIEIVQPKRISIRAKMNIEWAEIEPVLRGKLKEGFRLAEPPRAQPPRVKVTGSEKTIQTLKEANEGKIILKTDVVDISGESSSFFRTVKLNLPEGLELVNPEDEFVQVVVGVAEVEETKKIQSVPIEIKTFTQNIEPVYSPKTATIEVKAPLSVIKNLSANDFYCEPIQPIEETVGFQGKVAIEAKFREDVPPAVKEKVAILSVNPEAVDLEIKQTKSE